MFSTIKPSEATAGCKKLLTDEGCNEVAESFNEEIHDPIDLAYFQGVIAGLNFPVVPKEAQTYGMSVKDYAVNARNNIKDAIVADILGSAGVNVTVIELGRKHDDETPSDGDSE